MNLLPFRRARMGSQWTHEGQKKTKWNVCHFAFTEDVKVAENIQTLWNIETYASKIKSGERYKMGMLWSESEPNQPNNLSSVLGQLYTLGRKFQRDPNLERLYQQPIDTDVEKGFVKTLNESVVKGTFGKEWYLPHHPVLNQNKPGK